MDLIIGLLTLVLVIDSLFLTLLILIQLPKKEAGLGLAFGASTTDALFGAGSGTVVSRITKYSAGVFLVLSLVLSVMRTHHAKTGSRAIADEIDRQATTSVIPMPVTVPSNMPLPVLPAAVSNLAPVLPVPAASNPPVPAPSAANQPAATPRPPAK